MKEQSVLEYLMLLVGTVLIAAVVVVLLFNLTSFGESFDENDCTGFSAFLHEMRAVTFEGELYCVHSGGENILIFNRMVSYKGEIEPAKNFIETDNGLIRKSEIRKLVKT